jgi:6-pyruvoyltetrahydropterin/6-carboxytetrahydropterin synthase
MRKISRTISFAYGHRLHEHKGKCAGLHGHNADVELTLESRELNGESMIMDFSEVNAALKSWIDSNLDHKTILCAKDPLLNTLRQAGQPCFETQASPTAEALAELIYRAMKTAGLPVSEVKFWETADSMASYSEKP